MREFPVPCCGFGLPLDEGKLVPLPRWLTRCVATLRHSLTILVGKGCSLGREASRPYSALPMWFLLLLWVCFWGPGDQPPAGKRTTSHSNTHFNTICPHRSSGSKNTPHTHTNPRTQSLLSSTPQTGTKEGEQIYVTPTLHTVHPQRRLASKRVMWPGFF